MTGSVSVVIPAFNTARFLGDALASVGAQTVPPHQCIVVDDGSSDDTRANAEEHPACTLCLSQPNRGVTAARNAGAARADGELLAFLDADDAWLPHRLETMRERLISTKADAVLCATMYTDEHLRPKRRVGLEPWLTPDRMLLGDVELVSTSSNLLIRRDAFERLGGFDEGLSNSADWELLFRIVDGVSWEYVPEPLVLYREHSAGMSRNVDRMATDMLRVYEDIFARAEGERLAIRRHALGTLHRVIAGSYFAAGRPREGVRHAIKSAVLAPSELRYLSSAAVRRLEAIARPSTPELRRRAAPTEKSGDS